MNERIKQQYNSLYTSQTMMYNEGKPLKTVCRLLDYLDRGSVLDIGGGEGRNALYLAAQGFAVSVLDISEVGIEKLQSAAKEKNLTINTHVCDVVTKGIHGTYNAVINSFVLHHLDTADAEKLIRAAQQHTTAGGVHVLATFMNQGDLYERNKKSERFYPALSTIQNLYADWSIKELQTREATTHARHKNGERMKNYILMLIAVKSNDSE